MTLRDYFRVIRRDWPIMLICVVLGFGLAAAATYLQKPTYTATASVFVSVQSQPSAADLSQGATFTQQMVLSYADLARKPIVLDPVIKQLGLRTTSAQLASHVDAQAPLDTVLIGITVSDASPMQAARIANAVSAKLTAAVPLVTPTTGRNVSPVKIAPVESAVPPITPSSPIIPLNLAVGLAIGLVVAIIASVIRETLDVRVRDLRDFELVSRKRVLGAVPVDAAARRNPLITQPGASLERAEAFRSLRTNLQFLDFGQGARAMVITSAVAHDGRSTTAANLAIAAAEAGASVALVDADLRDPSIGLFFGLDSEVGLTDALTAGVQVDELLCEVRPNLSVLPSGHVPPNPSDLLQSSAMVHVIDQLTRRFEVVIFDTPPVLAVSDAAILARRTSGALIVAASGRTTRHNLRDAATSLERIEAQVLGIVVTMLPRKRTATFERRTSARFSTLERPVG